MKINRIVIMTIYLAILCTSSCRTSKVSQVQLQLVQYALKTSDLAGRWRTTWQVTSVAYGGESYEVSYERDEFVFVGHTVSMHSSIERAQQAYEEWEASFFDVTNLQPEISYIPLGPTDDYLFECFVMSPDDPLMNCNYLQRHNTIISFVKIHFDSRSEENLTVEEMGDILLVLDKRLNGAE